MTKIIIANVNVIPIMTLSSKMQGLNYGAPLLGLPKSMYYSLTHVGTKFGD